MALRIACVGLMLSLAAVCGAEPARRASAERFSFVAMGCMPYGAETFPAYERLLAEVNRHRPAFTVHCGDTKKGSEPPTDALLARVKTWFDSIDGPLIYTPGDN